MSTPHSVPSSCTPCQPVLIASTSDKKYRFSVPFKVLNKKLNSVHRNVGPFVVIMRSISLQHVHSPCSKDFTSPQLTLNSSSCRVTHTSHSIYVSSCWQEPGEKPVKPIPEEPQSCPAYIKPEWPKKKTVDVIITHVVDPGHFYVQIMEEKEREELFSLQEDLK